MREKQTDIIISGAGSAGLTLGILLARAGLGVAIIDPATQKALSDKALSGRTVAMMNSSLNILKAAGVWPGLKDIANPLKTMTLIDISKGIPIEEAFDAQDIGEEQFGYNIPNNTLRAALFETANAENNITFYLESKLESYEVHGHQVHVKRDNNTIINANLLVGADGRNSKTREIAGIGIKKRHYNQSAVTFIINHSKSHNDISTEFHRSDGPLAIVPLPANQSAIVWVNKNDRCEELLSLAKAHLAEELQNEISDIIGGITLETEPECWPLCAIKAETLTAERVALIAEAAHVMSPITAQGLNLSLRDVAGLAEVIIDAARVGQDIGASTVLNAYEKRRRIDIETRAFGVDSMMRVVSHDLDAVKSLRRSGLKALSYAPPLKRFAMRIGLAPALDAGRLARGEAL